MKKFIVSLAIMIVLIGGNAVYASEEQTKDQVQTELVNVFMAIMYLDQQLDDASLTERLKIHIKLIALEEELARLGEVYKELESSK